MKKFIYLSIVAVLISACAGSIPPNVSDADQIATVVAGTLTAMGTANPPEETSVAPVDSFLLNGQLQGTLAFVRDYNVWVNSNGVERQITSDGSSAPEFRYYRPYLSPDGTKIMYSKDSSLDTVIVVKDVNGNTISEIADNVSAMKWSADSQSIYFLSDLHGTPFKAVKSKNLATGEVVFYGQITDVPGCGGGSAHPSWFVAMLERDPLFDLSPQNEYVLHATECGYSGLGIFELATQQSRTFSGYVGAKISPDGSKLAAISGSSIAIFDAASGNIENTFSTTEPPVEFLWDVDGKRILYSTSQVTETVEFEGSIADEVFGYSEPVSFEVFVSTLWIMDAANGQSSKLLDFDAYTLEPISVRGGKALVVSVENATRFFDYIAQGNLEGRDAYLPTTNIIEVDLNSGASTQVLNNVQQASYVK